MTELDLATHDTGTVSDISFWRSGESVFVTRVGEGPYATLDEVVEQTHNPRVLAQYDRAVVDGMLVRTGYEPEYKTVGVCHPMAGQVDRFEVGELMDTPALLVKAVPPADDTEVIDGGAST